MSNMSNVNMSNHSKDIRRKQFQQQLTVPPHKTNFIAQYAFGRKISLLLLKWNITDAAQIMNFSIKNFFSKCDQIRRKLLIWSHLLKKS